MKPFRLKDPATGLYYCPSREIQVKTPEGNKIYIKSNLSKKGKIYFKSYDGNFRSFYDHTQLIKTHQYPGYKAATRNQTFEVEYL